MEAMRTPAKICACAVFCILAFLGNWFKLELFFSVDFLFGSFFAMFAIMAIGGTYGVLVSGVAATCTYLLWNHPWAIIIFLAEAVFVAWAYARRKGNLVLYDILYWACIGIPLIYLFYYQLMGMQLQNTLVVMLKQSVNGVFNALMASLAFVLFRFTRRATGARVAYAQALFLVMVSLVLLPSTLLMISGMRTYQEKRIESLEGRVIAVSNAARKILAGWMEEHHRNVQILATLIGDPNTNSYEDMQHYVEIVRAATPVFKGMGVFNKDAVTVGYAPLEEDGKPTLGVDFSDRPQIAIMQREKKLYVSDLLVSRLGNPYPIVLFLAPIVISGEYRGHCSGVVEILQISGLLRNLAEPGIQITVTDGLKRVIVSTIPDLQTMDPFPRPYREIEESVDAGALLWKPDPQANKSFMQQWRNAFYFHPEPVSERCRWRVIVEASCLPLVEDISQYSLSRLGLLGLVVLLAVLFSHFLSDRFISSVVRLQALTRSLPQRLDDAVNIAWPESSIKELADLSSNFREMAFALHEDMTERERVESELRASRARLEAALGSIVDAVLISDADGQFIEFNEAFAAFHRFRNKDECVRTLAEYPEILDVVMANGEPAPLHLRAVPRALRGETATNVEYSLRRKDTGETWVGSYSFAPICSDDGAIIGSVVVGRDITELKTAEKALRDSLEEKLALLKEVHHRVKNNLQIVASLLGLQAGRSDNPHVIDVLQDTRNRVRSMALLHETLYRSGNLARINFATYLKDLCGQLLLGSGPVGNRIQLEYHVAQIGLPMEQAVPCGLIVGELVSNALKHGFPDNRMGGVAIRLERSQRHTLVLSVCDDGVGLPSCLEPGGASTLGLQLVSVLAGQLGGQFELEPSQGKGAAFRVIFPVPEDTLLGGAS